MLNNSGNTPVPSGGESAEMRQSCFSVLREAIAGSERDFTSGSIGLAIFLLSVSMISEMRMESVFAIVNIFFLAKLGVDVVRIDISRAVVVES